MKVIKKILPIALCLIFAFSLVACDKGGSGNDGGDTTVKGETIDTGKFSAICPEGWVNSPVKDLFSDEDVISDTQLQFFKADKLEDSTMFTADQVNIYYYDANTIYIDARDFYDNTEDFSIEVDGLTWSGYTGESFGYPILVLTNPTETFQVVFTFTAGDMDANSPDVKAIVGGLRVTE